MRLSHVTGRTRGSGAGASARPTSFRSASSATNEPRIVHDRLLVFAPPGASVEGWRGAGHRFSWPVSPVRVQSQTTEDDRLRHVFCFLSIALNGGDGWRRIYSCGPDWLGFCSEGYFPLSSLPRRQLHWPLPLRPRPPFFPVWPNRHVNGHGGAAEWRLRRREWLAFTTAALSVGARTRSARPVTATRIKLLI